MNILGIIAIPIFGYLITNSIWQKKPVLENLAYGYLIGWPIFTIALFIAQLLGLRFGLWESSLLLLILICLTLIIRIILKIPLTIMQKSRNKNNFTQLEYLLIILISFLLASSLLSGIYRVVSEWDALTLYDFRAKLFAQFGGMREAMLAQGSYFNSYPLHTSLVHMWYYLLGFLSPMTYYGGIFVSFVIAFYYSARRVSSRIISLLAALMLILSPHLFWHSQIAYTNLPYTISLVMGTILIIEWVKNDKISDLAVGALLTGVSVWIRHPEPFWMTNILIVLGASLYKRRFHPIILYLTLFLPFERIWKLFIANVNKTVAPQPLADISGGIITVANLSTIPILLSVVEFLVRNVFRPFIPVFIIYFCVIIWKLVRKDKFWLAELIILLNLGLLVSGTLLFAITQPYWQEIPGSLERIAIIFAPLILYSFVRAVEKIKIRQQLV